MTTDTLSHIGKGIVDWFPATGYLPSIQDESKRRLMPVCVDAVIASDLNSLFPQFETIDVKSKRVTNNHKLNGYHHSPLGFTLLQSVHDGYDATRVGQR